MKVASMPTLYLAFLTLSLAAAELPFPASPDDVTDSLQSSLATGGLQQPQVLCAYYLELRAEH